MHNKRVIILISGGGSNMESIARNVKNIDIVGVYADRKCGGIDRAKNLGLRAELISSSFFKNIADIIKEKQIDFIILAGFLKILPSDFVKSAPPILNIHPSLLPKYGGKGCHGINVHRMVLEANDKYSGASVHIVDTGIDTGPIIMQSFISIEGLKTAEEIAARVLTTEHKLYSMAINEFIRNGGDK